MLLLEAQEARSTRGRDRGPPELPGEWDQPGSQPLLGTGGVGARQTREHLAKGVSGGLGRDG